MNDRAYENSKITLALKSGSFSCSLITVFIIAAYNLISGCSPGSNTLNNITSQHLPWPTKDEIALVNGETFSLTDFEDLRSEMRDYSKEGVITAGIQALALISAAKLQGISLTRKSALQIVRYAYGDLPLNFVLQSLNSVFPLFPPSPSPEQVRRKLEYLIVKSEIRRNTIHLSLLGP